MSHFAALTATEFPQDLKAVFEKEMPDSSVVDFVARKMSLAFPIRIGESAASESRPFTTATCCAAAKKWQTQMR